MMNGSYVEYIWNIDGSSSVFFGILDTEPYKYKSYKVHT